MVSSKLTTSKTRRPKSASQSKHEARKWPGSKEFSERLQELIRLQARGSRSEFASLVGVYTSQVSAWCDGGKAPRADLLIRIAQHTHVSLDWLLGATLEMERVEHQRASSLGEALKAELPRLVPRGAEDFALSDITDDAEDFLQEVATAWWDAKLRKSADEAARRLERLASQLEFDATRSYSGLAWLLRLRVSQFRNYADRLRSALVRWESLDGFQLGGALIAENAFFQEFLKMGFKPAGQMARAFLVFPLDTWGGELGAGLAFRIKGVDSVWYVEQESGAVKHRRGRNLLVEPAAPNKITPMFNAFGVRS